MKNGKEHDLLIQTVVKSQPCPRFNQRADSRRQVLVGINEAYDGKQPTGDSCGTHDSM